MTDYLPPSKDNRQLLDNRKFQNIIALIEEDVVKCRAKPHIQALPHNLLTNDPDKLHERLDAINAGLKDAQAELKTAQQEEKDLTKSINDLEEENAQLKDENDKLYKENSDIWAIGGKVYEHFNKVSIQAEEDSWQIKKAYNKMKSSLKGTDDDRDFTDLDEKMRVLTDDMYHDGYLPKYLTDPDNPTVTPPHYINDILKPMIAEIRDIGTPEAEGVANRMDDYIYRYDITGRNPNTNELKQLDKGLSDLWPDMVDKNKNQIKKNTKQIEGNMETLAEQEATLKEKGKQVKEIQTKIDDYNFEKDRTNNKLD